MSVFIIPSTIKEEADGMTILEKSGVPLLSPAKFHELYSILLEGRTFFLAANSNVLWLITNKGVELLDELPIAVIGFPGAVYGDSFLSNARRIHNEHWDVIKKTFQDNSKAVSSVDELHKEPPAIDMEETESLPDGDSDDSERRL